MPTCQTVYNCNNAKKNLNMYSWIAGSWKHGSCMTFIMMMMFFSWIKLGMKMHGITQCLRKMISYEYYWDWSETNWKQVKTPDFEGKLYWLVLILQLDWCCTRLCLLKQTITHSTPDQGSSILLNMLRIRLNVTGPLFGGIVLTHQAQWPGSA